MSKWVEHIKDFAKRNNMTYGCALSDPKCSEEYRVKNPKTVKAVKGKKLDLSKTEFVPLEEAEIDTEPKTKMVIEKKPPAPEKKKRGRPPKALASVPVPEPVPEPEKKKRGRPVKGKGIKLTRDMVMKMVGEGMKC